MRLNQRCSGVILAIAGFALGGGAARAMSLSDANLVDLMRESTSIVAGNVMTVTDGVDASTGVPYTEITLVIRETLRGTEQGTYTFRQFGLAEARTSQDGLRRLAAPDGFPRYAEGEDVLLFLAKPAAITGLRSTYALDAGKFTFGPGRVENELANEGLFHNVSVHTSLATDNDVRMLETEIGAVNPDAFMSLVRRAVDQQWVETCLMWDTVEGKTCGNNRRELDRPDARRQTDRNAAPQLQTIGAR